MSFASFLTRSLRGPVEAQAPPQAKASAAGPLVAFQTLGRAVWTPRDYGALARRAYVENAVAHRCLRLIAESAASVPVLLMRGDAPMERHPLLDLLQRPNPSQSGPEFLEHLYGHLVGAGNAYVEAAGPPEAPPRELYILRPDRMRLIPGPDGWPESYEYRVEGRFHRFPMRGLDPPILHLKTFHPLDDHYGLSALEAAAVAVDLHGAAAVWNKALLDNAARPSGAIVYSGADSAGRLTDSQYDRLKEELETHHQGPRNAGRPMLLEGGLDWKPMGFSPADMEFLKSKENAAREIALALGVPPMLLGLPGDNTYANYQEANRAFLRQTILPLLHKASAALTNWLGPRFGPDLALIPDLDEIPALSSERDAYWARVAGADFLSLAEKRALLGFGPPPPELAPSPPSTPEA